MIPKEAVEPTLVTELLQYMSASVDKSHACFWKRYFLQAWSSYRDINVAFSLWQSTAPITMEKWVDKAKEILQEINDDSIRLK